MYDLNIQDLMKVSGGRPGEGNDRQHNAADNKRTGTHGRSNESCAARIAQEAGFAGMGCAISSIVGGLPRAVAATAVCAGVAAAHAFSTHDSCKVERGE